MEISIRPLADLDDARAVAGLVHAAYGFTYHRRALYDPGQLLALNRAGHVRSMLAWSGGRCVGHLALIRPAFELAGDLPESTSADVGQCVVHPDAREHGVEARLRAAITERARSEGLACLHDRVPVGRTGLQREVLEEGGVPTAVFLAGIPVWIRWREQAGADGRPLSTLNWTRPLRAAPPRTLWLPRLDSDLLGEVVERLGLPRTCRPAPENPRPAPPTRLVTSFDPVRRQGRIHVVHAGPDVGPRVLEAWASLAAGRLHHVTVLAPLGSPHTAAAVAAWKASGLLFGGLLPETLGDDQLVLQGIHQSRVETRHLAVVDPLARRLLERAISDWRLARDVRPPVEVGAFDPAQVRCAG